MLQIVKGIQNQKTSPRHLNFLKQLKKTNEIGIFKKFKIVRLNYAEPFFVSADMLQ